MTGQWRWIDDTGARVAAFTDRRAGNLATHVGDDPTTVAAARDRLRDELGARHVLFADQVHSATVVVADGPWSQPPAADAIVTAVPGLFLAVMVADCVPVVLTSDTVVGVAHAGRAGMVAGVVGATVDAMRRAGAGDITAHLGPSICARCYEVPAALRDEVGATVPLAASITRYGTPSLDIAAGVAGQLVSAGVDTTILPGCTAEDDSLFSYRREGRTGRLVGVVGLR